MLTVFALVAFMLLLAAEPRTVVITDFDDTPKSIAGVGSVGLGTITLKSAWANSTIRLTGAAATSKAGGNANRSVVVLPLAASMRVGAFFNLSVDSKTQATAYSANVYEDTATDACSVAGSFNSNGFFVDADSATSTVQVIADADGTKRWAGFGLGVLLRSYAAAVPRSIIITEVDAIPTMIDGVVTLDTLGLGTITLKAEWANSNIRITGPAVPTVTEYVHVFVVLPLAETMPLGSFFNLSLDSKGPNGGGSSQYSANFVENTTMTQFGSFNYNKYQALPTNFATMEIISIEDGSKQWVAFGVTANNS